MGAGDLASRLANRLLRRRSAAVSELVGELDQNGETQVSPASARDFLRDRIVQGVVELFRSQVRTARWVNALLIAGSLALPVGLCWTLRFFS
jgi:hypothetical protein